MIDYSLLNSIPHNFKSEWKEEDLAGRTNTTNDYTNILFDKQQELKENYDY